MNEEKKLSYKTNLKSASQICSILLWGLVMTGSRLYSQSPLVNSTVFRTNVPKETQLRLEQALDTLIYHIHHNQSITSEVDSTGIELNKTMFGTIKGIGIYGNKKNDSLYSPQLTGLYVIGAGQYFISVAYVGNNTLKAIINFVATVHPDDIRFSIPLFYLTRNWQIKKVGRITYHYVDHINMERAVLFNKKNTRIAEKLGLPPQSFDFYLVDNYLETLRLLGYSYDSETAGLENDGFGPVNGYIFSISHNEDFSHDLFHEYASKVRTHTRNNAAEEGIGYSWGNPYYTDEHGEMISRDHLVKLLKEYLLRNPDTSLLDLFNKNPPILPSKTKVRSLLASLISDEVERRRGVAGIKLLIDCGRGDDSYFKVTDQLVDINASNFNTMVRSLLEKYN
jgi:hypothetical protein